MEATDEGLMGYAAGTETTMRITDLVWKLA
jgi:hypothetical protein